MHQQYSCAFPCASPCKEKFNAFLSFLHPHVSRFFLSLEDDLFRVFGGDRIKNLMMAFRCAGLPNSSTVSPLLALPSCVNCSSFSPVFPRLSTLSAQTGTKACTHSCTVSTGPLGPLTSCRVEDLPMESQMLTDALDTAQKRVENYFFDIRK